MTVAQLSEQTYAIAHPHVATASLKDELLAKKAVAIIEDGTFIGLLSQQDVATCQKVLAVDCLRPKPQLTKDCSPFTALKIMVEEDYYVLPIVEAGALHSILSKDRLLQWFAVDRSAVFKQKVSTMLPILGNHIDVEEDWIDTLTNYSIWQNQLLQNISHDLRSPIARASGLVEIMGMEEDPKKKDFYMEHISSNLKKSLALIEDLYEFTNQKSLKEEAAANPLHLQTILQEQVEDFRLDAKPKCIQVNLADIDESLTVACPSATLSRILGNLVGNAIKFSHPDSAIEIGAHDNGTFVEVYVSDLGIGMDKETLKNIFQPYGMQNRKGTQGEGSTGLGMGIVKQLIDRLGGKMNIMSEVDKGTTVMLMLPKVTL